MFTAARLPPRQSLRAPGVPEQGRRVSSKVLPHLVEVIHLGTERSVLWAHMIRGASPPPLIVVDEAERIFQSIQVGQEIAAVEVGPAVEDDDRWAGADFPQVQRRTADRDAAFDRVGAGLGLKSPRRSRGQRSQDPGCDAGGNEMKSGGFRDHLSSTMSTCVAVEPTFSPMCD